MPFRRVHVAGLTVVDLDVDSAVDRLVADACGRVPRVFVFVNAHSATLRRSDRTYAELLDESVVLPLPDGVAIAFGARLTGQRRIGRAPGPDVFESACAVAARQGLRFALVGGMPGTVAQLATQLRVRHPGLRIVLELTPPVGTWRQDQTDALVTAIRDSDADVVWLGVSAPRQETWAFDNIGEIARPVLCVGAAFDFLAGNKPRAPRWMRRIGMEWLFRLAKEPARLGRRYLVGNVVFMADLVRFRSRRADGWPAHRDHDER